VKGAFYAEISEQSKTRTPYFHWNSRGKGGVSERESEGNKKDEKKNQTAKSSREDGD